MKSYRKYLVPALIVVHVIIRFEWEMPNIQTTTERAINEAEINNTINEVTYNVDVVAGTDTKDLAGKMKEGE
ncbi:MAG: hypothetical protein R2798_14300 [Chitinophagales bacterium]|nr:hypothetical protein [Bacteroidota bacterium]MCB9043461.1 hypothetical protein [Chitinophagales bacterium]